MISLLEVANKGKVQQVKMRFKVESALAHSFLPDLLDPISLYTPRAQEMGWAYAVLCRCHPA